jgi:hypothetical protein
LQDTRHTVRHFLGCTSFGYKDMIKGTEAKSHSPSVGRTVQESQLRLDSHSTRMRDTTTHKASLTQLTPQQYHSIWNRPLDYGKLTETKTWQCNAPQANSQVTSVMECCAAETMRAATSTFRVPACVCHTVIPVQVTPDGILIYGAMRPKQLHGEATGHHMHPSLESNMHIPVTAGPRLLGTRVTLVTRSRATRSSTPTVSAPSSRQVVQAAPSCRHQRTAHHRLPRDKPTVRRPEKVCCVLSLLLIGRL